MATQWPLQLDLGDETIPALDVYDKPLHLIRRGAKALHIDTGEEISARHCALPSKCSALRFLPSFGERALLAFPTPQLLCPAGLTMQVMLAMPLGLRLEAIHPGGVVHLMDMPAPRTSPGLYGPVDSGQICTSFRAPVSAPDEDDHFADHPICEFELRLAPSEHREGSAHALWAKIPLRVTNTTPEPREVSKIMLPTASLGLYRHAEHDELWTSQIEMRLLGPNEAEVLIEGGPEGAEPIAHSGRRATAHEPRRAYTFLHAYRAKTGLEHGF